MARGARRFVFLDLTGCDKPSSAQLVSRLRGADAEFTVVRGDISNADDVDSSVAACIKSGYPIGCVVQAAMGLYASLFIGMTSANWHTAIDPKWAGHGTCIEHWKVTTRLLISSRSRPLYLGVLDSRPKATTAQRMHSWKHLRDGAGPTASPQHQSGSA